MQLSAHGEKRMQQGAVRNRDLNLFMRFGTEFGDGLILREKDVAEAICSMRAEMRRLEKLSGKAVILKGDTILTTYTPSKKRRKIFLMSRVAGGRKALGRRRRSRVRRSRLRPEQNTFPD